MPFLHLGQDTCAIIHEGMYGGGSLFLEEIPENIKINSRASISPAASRPCSISQCYSRLRAGMRVSNIRHTHWNQSPGGRHKQHGKYSFHSQSRFQGQQCSVGQCVYISAGKCLKGVCKPSPLLVTGQVNVNVPHINFWTDLHVVGSSRQL